MTHMGYHTLLALSLPPLISTRTPCGIFLLMLGIQARIIPWTITNNIGVDAKRDYFRFKVRVRSKVK